MVNNSQTNKYIIHADGGSRGNPGPAAIGVVIEAVNGSSVGWLRKDYSQFIGKATNNEAEYQAVIFALKKLKQLAGKKVSSDAIVEARVDSELLARQVNGKYKITDKNMQALFMELWNLRLDFGEVIFNHIPREDNRGADKLVNSALDKELNKLI